MTNLDIGQYILYMIAFIFSLSVHEAAHAWMSNYFGDDLAQSQGRISLNPVTHVDPIGTLLFPTIAFFTGAPLLGWARPTPVNPLRWRDKRTANIWVSAAGVICNAIIAIVAGVSIRTLIEFGLISPVEGGEMIAPAESFTSGAAMGAVQLLKVFFEMNIVLAVFNLLPIPPLDGSKILGSLLPERFESAFEAIERFGFVILLVAVFTGIFSVIFNVVIPFAWNTVFIGLPFYVR